MRLRIFVLGYFHSFHKHMRSLLRIHPSSLLKTDFVSARAKYPHHPIRYWFSLCILYSIEYGIFLDVISRTLFFILWMLSLAMRILGSLEIVKLKPRNLRFHGRSTDDLLSFTFLFHQSLVTCHCPFSCPLRFHLYVAVIGISNKSVSSSF